MRVIFLIVFMFVFTVLHSQDLNKIIKSIEKEYASGDYEKALKSALYIDSLYQADYDSESTDYSMLLSLTGSIYFKLKLPGKSDTCYRKSLENFRQYSDFSQEPGYITTLNNYALMLISEEHYVSAEPLVTEALEILKEDRGEKSEEYAYSLSILGNLQMNAGNLKDAEANFLSAISIWKIKDDARNSDYANALYDLAYIYSELGQYKSSLPIYLEVSNKFRKIWGPASSDYASSLSILATVHTELSDFESAMSSLQKAIEISIKADGNKSQEFSLHIFRLARLYQEMGNYSKAEEHYKKALTIQNEGGFDSGNSLFFLSSLYQIMGDFAAAEKLCLEVLNKDRKEGEMSANYLYTQNLLANLYTLMGSYDKALILYKNIVDKSKTVLGADSPDYAVNLDNLANLYLAMGEFRESESLALEALEIKKVTYGELSPSVAYSFRNLGDVYEGLRQFPQAEIYRKKEMEINFKILGELHNDYASSIAGLASIYNEEGKYSEAEQLYEKAVSIVKKVFGEKHPQYGNLLLRLAETEELLGKSDAAEPLYLKVNENLNNQIKQNFSFMAEKEKEEFIITLANDFENLNSFVYRRKDTNKAITSLAYNNELELKGIVLQSSKTIRQAALNSNDKELIKLYDAFYQNKQLLTKLNMLSPEGRWLNADSLETLCTIQEKELSKGIQDLPGLKDFTGIGSQVRWEEIQKALGEDEAAIEYISFPNYDLKNRADTSVLYCAILLKPGMLHPEMIPLFKEEELALILKEAKSFNDETTAGNLYRMQSSESDPSPVRLTNSLYHLIWEPVDSMLTGIRTIYYSPTGLLNKISFDAIPAFENKYLSDKYTLNAVLSTRVILDKKTEILQVNKNLKPVIYGGINYDSDTTKMKSEASRYAGTASGQRGHFNPGDSNRGGSFSFLDGTLSEAQNIQKLLIADMVSPVVITGDDATEESFKSLNNLRSPVFIHIATHGFSFPVPKVKISGQTSTSKKSYNPFKNSENPLLRSGLIFAGANNAWNNKPLPSGVDDGILLASEVAEMYMPNTQLVVLSACETGLGEIKGSEGVFGLQRAFKMAGVKYLITSLWQVPDFQTSLLMSKFYEYWLSGLPIRDSFKRAQAFLKLENRGNPFNWAAFVLTE